MCLFCKALKMYNGKCCNEIIMLILCLIKMLLQIASLTASFIVCARVLAYCKKKQLTAAITLRCSGR